MKNPNNDSVLPHELSLYDDELLAVAREEVDHYKASDLRNFGEPTVIDLIDGRQTTYYSYPVEESRGNIVFFQPVANSMKPQAMAQVLAMQALTKRSVTVIEQNNYKLNHRERQLVSHGDFAPLGEIRLQAIEQALGRSALDDELTISGFSFGATDAAATSAAIARHDAFEIDGAVYGEPTNILRRSLLSLGKAFAGTSDTELLGSVLMAKFPALTELWDISSDGKKSSYLNKDLRGFVIDFSKHRNITPVRGLCYPNFANDVVSSLATVKPSGNIIVHKDDDSVLTPRNAFDRQIKVIKDAVGTDMEINIEDIRTTTDEKVGHAIGDNPWAWSTIVRLALKDLNF